MTSPIIDLEENIMNCWHIIDDIDLLYENVMSDMSADNIASVLLGLKHLYQMRFDKCFNSFEKVSAVVHEMRNSRSADSAAI